ncbi:uncharacterized protein DFL_000706 [Arthrobotrys flagrans]|uniref:Uncharacterized protein n=1 Tax=Arthrobotrys flagrans TaxID=97331 RepID=A0A437AF12_ARTFL|nr:hypothetical protein DFL_000706 [Arthrobotrys flagrans]
MLAYSDTILSHFLKPGYLPVITQEEGIPLGYTMGELTLLDLEIMWQNYDGDPADEVDVSGALGLDENYDTDEEDGSSG